MTCATNCPQGSPDTSGVDCAAAISLRLASGDRIIGGSCSFNDNSCSSTASICNTDSGDRPNISITLECRPAPPPPPPPPPGGEDDSGCTGNGTCRMGEYRDCDKCCGYAQGIWEYGTCNFTPIVIDVAGDGFDLTDAANGVRFDLSNGRTGKLQVSWTSPNSDDAWLVLDRNENGNIDNGTELFGSATPQLTPLTGTTRNGFLALAWFDRTDKGGNGDGVITTADPVFPKLRLWQDTNHNGISEANELHTLESKGIVGFDLDYKESKRTDAHGNQFKYRAKVRDAHGTSVNKWAWDVFLVRTQ